MSNYLIFPNLSQALTREAQFVAALGYPDPENTWTKYCNPDQHPTSGEAALIITRVCSCETTPYYIKDAAELLTPAEVSSLQSWEQMQAAGWFPEPTP